MTFEFLWTDKCFLILLILGTLTILLSLRKQHIRRSFTMILHRPIAVSAGIILLAFMTIGVLDSIHFQPNNQSNATISVLDKLLSPIDEINEKTYSAPLALYQFVTDTMLVNGVVTQFFPRLNYPAKWVSTEAEKVLVIKSKAWYSLQWGGSWPSVFRYAHPLSLLAWYQAMVAFQFHKS